MVDAARTRAFEEREGAFGRVEHHLVRLTRIGAYEHNAAAAGADMRATFKVIVTPLVATIS